jgi:excinuclease ABC subunit A
MHFLPDVYVECDTCSGKRYNRETLEIAYRGLSIADALELTVDDASQLFESIPRIAQRLAALRQVGLGYIQLGQPATTLSGGEAQRVKLASELARTATGKTLYVLDEPTTGLHFSDIELLTRALYDLRDAGNSIVLIEHNLDLIACADWVIDMGPEGGEKGGRIIVAGTPEQVAQKLESHTGRYLSAVLAEHGPASVGSRPARTGAKSSRRPTSKNGAPSSRRTPLGSQRRGTSPRSSKRPPRRS